MAEQIEVELVLETKKATKAVEDFSKSTQKQLDTLNLTSAITAINSAFEIASKAYASARVAIEKTIGAAIEFEQVVTDLTQSLKVNGNNTAGAVENYIELADAIEAATGIQDELILSSIRTAQTFGLTNEQTQKALRAAVELSVAFGEDLNTSLTRVAKTLNGLRDRELDRTFVAIRNLTKEQLAAGGAADFLNSKLAGTAAAASKTAGGELRKLSNTINDAFRDLGRIILPKITDGLVAINSELNKTISFFAESVKKAQQLEDALLRRAGLRTAPQQQEPGPKTATAEEERARKLADDAKEQANQLFLIKEENESKIKALIEQNLTAGLGDAEKLQKEYYEKLRLLDIGRQTGIIKNDVALGVQRAAVEAENLKKTEELRRKQEKELIEFRKAGLSELDAFEVDATQQRKDLENVIKDQRIENEELIAALREGNEKRIAEKRLEVEKKSNIAFAEDFLAAYVKAIKDGRELTQEEKNAAAVGFGANALRGEKGATNLLGSAGGLAAEAIAPGTGAIGKEIFNELAKGPEEVKKTVTAFVQSIPTIITNVIAAIPQVILTLFKEIPKAIITFFKEGLPELLKSLGQAIPQIITQLVVEAPKIAIALIQGIIEGIPKIIVGFVEGLIQGAQDFVNALLDAIGSPFEAVGDFFSGIGDFIGLAEGGRVPDSPRFAGDNFPARLDAGEQVFSRDLTGRLENFLDSQGQSSGNGAPQNITVNLKIGERELANVLLDINRRGFRTA